MRNFVVRLFVNALALSLAAYLVRGIHLSGGFGDILLVAFVFGVVNALLKPILLLLSFPFLILSLGLFAFVVNGVLLLVTAALTDHLAIDGLGSAIVGSLVVSLVTLVLGGALKDKGEERH